MLVTGSDIFCLLSHIHFPALSALFSPPGADLIDCINLALLLSIDFGQQGAFVVDGRERGV